MLTVIFDLDGLLADTEPLWSESARLLLERKERIYDPTLRANYMGRAPLEVAQIMIQQYDLDDEPAALVRQRLQILEGLYREATIGPLPGAQDLVLALAQQQVPMAVASGSPTHLVQLVLQRLGLRESMAVCLGSDAVARGKPAPDVFLLASRHLDARPGHCVVLEDAAAGVQAALAAQMFCVAVPSPETPAEEVAAAHLVVQSLEQISPADLHGLI